MLVVVPSAGVKLPFSVSFTRLLPLSCFRPWPVSVILTLALPAPWNVTLAVATSTGLGFLCLSVARARWAPFGTRYQLITSWPVLGAVNVTTRPPRFKSRPICAAWPGTASAFASAAFTWALVGPAATTGPTRLDTARVLPALSVAATRTAIFAPTSALVTVYVLDVAPAIGEHELVHRAHW